MLNSNLKKLTFQRLHTKCISNLPKDCDINRAGGIDNLSGRFLKVGADMLTTFAIYSSNSLTLRKTVK